MFTEKAVLSKRIENLLNRSQIRPLANRHQRFVMNTSLILVGLLGFALTMDIVGLTQNIKVQWFSPFINLTSIIVSGLGWRLTAKGRIKLASRILVLTVVVHASIYYLIVFSNLITLFSFLTIALLALALINNLMAYVVLGWSAIMSIYLLLNERLTTINPIGPELPQKADLISCIMIYLFSLLIISLVIYMSNNLKYVNLQLNQQSEQLEAALEEIELKRVVGEDVSREVFSLTAQLNANVVEQASGSEQQVSAITEMSAFLEEMTRTAQNIAAKAGQLHQAAAQIQETTRRVKTATAGVTIVGENGAEAVESTIERNQYLSGFYSDLRTILTDLGQRQSQIREVVTTIRGISDETHLLSLNAAIEAAGAGECGERFGVVASEVKALADRAVRASRQINGILGQVEDGIQQAVEKAGAGQQEVQMALETARQSGEVLRELVVSIYQNNEEVEQIEIAASSINEQTVEISTATVQQYNASQQALETLQAIGSVATQVASNSGEMSRSTQNLEALSRNLLAALAA